VDRAEFCVGGLLGLFEPNPCGARPRSVVLPCASQVRELLVGRCPELPTVPFAERFEFGIAEGGRFCESSCWRAVVASFARALPGLLPTPVFALAEPFTCEWPSRPALTAPFIRSTGTCEAAAAGAVRAITERFWTPAGGRGARGLMFALPRALCWVGRMPTEVATLALFKEAWVIRCAPRWMG
jgi:hypothetical protein